MSKQPTCEERIDGELADTLATLQAIWDQTVMGDAEYADEDGGESNLYEYGLSFDYVEPGTFGDDQDEGYWRYQLSWGGPSDEFRFYVSPGGCAPYKILYHFMDWFDSAERYVHDPLLDDIWEWHEPAWVESLPIV